MALAATTPMYVLSFQYYAESHGVIYVIDSTDEERLSESKRAFGKCAVFDQSCDFIVFLGTVLSLPLCLILQPVADTAKGHLHLCIISNCL